ncbi:hypothetical protein E8E11_005244 [Didymella keratinophila]|nr:hypothetical protein E8E11_005244 [Didymella keratinophila]
MSIDQDTGQSTTEAKATGDYLYAAALSVLEEGSSDDEAHRDTPENDTAGKTQHTTDNTYRQCPMATDYKGKAELRIPHPSGKGWYEQFDEFPTRTLA